MIRKVFILFLVVAGLLPVITATRTNRNLNLQTLQTRCLTSQSTAARSSSCVTQKKLKMQITRGVENGVFYCLTYEKSSGNVYGFDSLTIELHPDYDLQYSGANVIDYEYPSFKLYDVRVTQEYKGRFAIYSNNTSFKIWQVTINNEPQTCTYGKGKNRQSWPEPRKEETEEEEEITTVKMTEKSTTEATTTTTAKPLAPSKTLSKSSKIPKVTTSTLPPTTEPPTSTTQAPTTEPPKTTQAPTTTTVKITTLPPTTTELPVTTEPPPDITTELPVITTIPPEPKVTEKCGAVQKIVDLKQFLVPYNPGEFPFAVSIFQRTENEEMQLKCSGTIISSEVVLTSVNCLLDHNARLIKEEDLVIFVAQYAKDSKMVNSSKGFEVEKILPHEGFNFNLDNNLAAIKLKRVIEFDDFVQPICLPERNKDITDESTGKVVGFGKSNMLTESDFKIEMNEICKESSCQTFNGHSSTVVENIDLGCGLYVSDKENHWTLVGISSMIPQRASTNVTFTNVSYFMDWIERLFN